MNFIKKIGVFFISIIVLLAFVGIFLPSTSHVERATTINAPPAVIFSLVNDVHAFNQWSPWAKKDPATKYRFEGPNSGVGAKMYWESDNPQVGVGNSTIVISEPNSHLRTALDFGEMGGGTSDFRLTPTADGVNVVWSFDTEHGFNLVNRYFGLMYDKWVGKDYEDGLANLKALAETAPGEEPGQASSAITTETITYMHAGTPLMGYLAYPNDGQAHPGILVVHEWWGHNDYARKRAEQLAELGYTAFALDMYGDGKVAAHPKDAMKFMNEVIETAGVAKARFEAALTLLKQQSATDVDNIAAIGYCFGGGTVMSMARSGMDLKGVASFHGGLKGLAPINADAVKAKFLVMNGEADPFITAEQKQAFKTEMDAAGLDYEFIDYPDAKHSFTNPDATANGKKFDLPLEYNAEVDAQSWQRLQAFLDQLFK